MSREGLFQEHGKVSGSKNKREIWLLAEGLRGREDIVGKGTGGRRLKGCCGKHAALGRAEGTKVVVQWARAWIRRNKKVSHVIAV